MRVTLMADVPLEFKTVAKEIFPEESKDSPLMFPGLLVAVMLKVSVSGSG